MKILVAPDKFKGSLTSAEVIEAITEGIKSTLTYSEIIQQPIADGGEGTLDILSIEKELIEESIVLNDPLFRPIKATYLRDDQHAFIEMASASGLLLLHPEERNALVTTTYGTGQLIDHAIRQGCREINLFIGGSATNDCGLGMLSALGFQFFDIDGSLLSGVGEDLCRVAAYKNPSDERLSEISFRVLTDVDSPLLGPNGAAHVYASQKGADQEAIQQLETGAKKLSQLLNNGFEDKNGAGAAGGLGYGALSFLNAELSSGIDYILSLTRMEQKVRAADLVITGEGSVDRQSLQGKVIDGLKRLCDQHNKPIAIVCGRSDMRKWSDVPIYQIMDKAVDLDDAMSNTAVYLQQLTKDLIIDFQSKNS